LKARGFNEIGLRRIPWIGISTQRCAEALQTGERLPSDRFSHGRGCRRIHYN